MVWKGINVEQDGGLESKALFFCILAMGRKVLKSDQQIYTALKGFEGLVK